MSSRHNLQDATGVITRHPVKGVTSVQSAVAPTAGKAGYATGCQWTNLKGTLGGILFVNTGSNTSATWTNIV